MTRRERAGLTIAWLAALGVSAGLAIHRYDATLFSFGNDFGLFFRAAQEVAAGHSPYLVSAYRYPPFLAILLAPFTHIAYESVFKAWLVLGLAALMVGAATFPVRARCTPRPRRRAAAIPTQCLCFFFGLFSGARFAIWRPLVVWNARKPPPFAFMASAAVPV